MTKFEKPIRSVLNLEEGITYEYEESKVEKSNFDLLKYIKELQDTLDSLNN